MSRSVRAYLVCVAALSLGGCFKHHTVEEGSLVPLDDDGGDDDGINGGDIGDGDGGDGDGDGDTNGGDGDTSNPLCAQLPAELKPICEGATGGAAGDGDQMANDQCAQLPEEVQFLCDLGGTGTGGLLGGTGG